MRRRARALSTAIHAVAIALFLLCFYLFVRERAARSGPEGRGEGPLLLLGAHLPALGGR